MGHRKADLKLARLAVGYIALAFLVFISFHPTLSNAEHVAGHNVAVNNPIFQLRAELEELTERVDALETANQALRDQLACVSTASDSANLYFEGCNVHVRNGVGQTDSINGFGNLIVGYNRAREPDSDKTGSHNLVIGDDHNYSRFGGFVAGNRNTISGDYASVSGGNSNTARGQTSSVSGGAGNTASGNGSSVSGGGGSHARGPWSSVSGGSQNTAFETYSSVSGGARSTALGSESSVSGGRGNTASGRWSSVSGGDSRSAPNDLQWVAGSLSEPF